MKVVLLAGGFGGAKMAHGFALLGADVELTVIGNTADDLEMHGLHVSPDLDTLMYTLAGIINREHGWGVADETWSATAMLERYGQPTWFRLGDRDLATHIVRTARLRAGESLTDVTRHLCASLGVQATLLPMSDDRVRTRVRVADGWLDFQDYFVRRRHSDDVLEVAYDGIAAAKPTDQVIEAIAAAEAIVLAPSNPFVSIGPILGLPGMSEALAASPAPVVAVSPIVHGAALRGPAEQMLRSVASEAGAGGVARHYARSHAGLVNVFVIDESDRDEAPAVSNAGMQPLVAATVMRGDEDRRRLAQDLLAATIRRDDRETRRAVC